MDYKTKDISVNINEIIDSLTPIYNKSADKGDEEMMDFVVGLFGACAKLCDELGVSQEDANFIFDRTWDALRKFNAKDLN